MSKLVADAILERLRLWGIHRIYGYPGDGINALLGALDRAEGDPELIQARHEEMAAFMACGHAKFTGEVGVCMATSGPGAIHLLNGLYDAKLDHQPVVAIVGQQARTALGGSYQQEVDLRQPLQGRGARVRRDGRPSRADPPPDRPRRADRARRAHGDVRDRAERPRRRRTRSRRRRTSTARSTRRSATCRRASSRATPTSARAADVLNAGERVAMLVGAGRARRDRRGDRDCRAARRRRREGAARSGGAARRPPVRDRRRSACSGRSRAGS